MRTEMRARLGINNCFAVKRWPRPGDWAAIVADDLGLDTVELSLDLLTGLAAYSLNLLMHPDAEHRAAARRWYQQVIDLTAQLGATAAGGHVGALTVPDAADRAVRAQRWAGLR